VVKDVGDGTKLIEFYISKYPDEFDRKTRLLISEIKKVMKNPRSSDIVDVDKIGFVTNKAIGAANGLEFIYEVEKFYKVTEHDGHYVIKFMVRPLVDGEFIFNKHKLDDLEKKYASKAPKNLKK
jgi:ATP-dependent protease HslVU (ClpYQ) ATPase subunit